MADNLNVTTEHESPTSWPDLAKQIVRDQALALDKDPFFDVYVVWYCFILGGWKALCSTTRPDGRYYEVTYNKEKGEAYVDTYMKTHNIAVKIDNGECSVHDPVQHRDGKPPWCDACGLDVNHKEPVSRI